MLIFFSILFYNSKVLVYNVKVMSELLSNDEQVTKTTKWDILTTPDSQPIVNNRQQRKLVNYYLSGGRLETIFNQRDANVTQDDKSRALVMIQNGQVSRDMQHNLLESINGPLTPNPQMPREAQLQRVLGSIETNPIKIHIFESVIGFNPGQSQRVQTGDLEKFCHSNPTPMEFDAAANKFLQQFDASTKSGKEALRLYSAAMRQFKYDVYGKQQEYFDQMKVLEKEALATKTNLTEHESRKSYREESADQTPSVFKKIGSKVIDTITTVAPRLRHELSSERFELVKSSGAYTINKGDLIGRPERRNEDSCFNDPQDGLFGVFDGMGGHADGAKASETAALELMKFINERPIRTQNDLHVVLKRMSTAVRQETRGKGGATAVLGQIIENVGQKYLLYAWAGDSRIYHVRNGVAKQITKDEGNRNVVTNYLGIPAELEKPIQSGILPLAEGDHLMFCSDGITGDVEKDFIPNRELAAIIENATSTDEAAKNLTRRATKNDDRTAIVVEI